MKDVFVEAGISVTPKNKKEIDQAIHKLMEVKYKKCMPDCWSEVKKTLANDKERKSFVSALKKAVA
jgi:hypothetical protein